MLYAALRPRDAAGRVREGGRDYGFAYSERHLRCVWFDAAFRPRTLHTHAGEDVVIEDPGRWNLESGPDFLDAVLRVGPERRRVMGDVEVHIRPSGWKDHGHPPDARYRRVAAHVTYFPGTVPPSLLPPGAVQIALKNDLAADPFFCFESLDLSAYPYAARRRDTPCAEALARLGPDTSAAVLESAGTERLRIKSERLAAMIAERGPETAIYEEIMSGLGYKNNRVPFRTLARKVPPDVLREAAGGDPVRGYALLAGVAGLLPLRPAPAWDHETRAFVRRLWDIWWKLRSSHEAGLMSRDAWALSGIRPSNHPARRLMAAASLFVSPTPMAERLVSALGTLDAAWAAKAAALFQPPDPSGYWTHHCGFAGRRQSRPIALVGGGRAAAMVTNIVIPFLAASGAVPWPEASALRRLPAEEDNALIRQAAAAVLGRDRNPAISRTGLRQQGLIQIFHDFCLNDRSACRECPFPAALCAGAAG